jgi:CDP-6-deoxy-D-xylo-4-hexulose-3-dehydrase
LNAVLGREQLKRLDANIDARTSNLKTWLGNLNPKFYWTDYTLAGSSNYALPLVLQDKDVELMDRVIALLQAEGVEYRRGTAGGGNQLRQPYLDGFADPKDFPVAEHVHEFGVYVGNFPGLKSATIIALATKLNAL